MRKTTYAEEVELSDSTMEWLVKENIKKPYISKIPKRSQLFFLFQLMVNRRRFSLKWTDMLLLRVRSLVNCCCKKRCERRVRELSKSHK